MKHTALARLRFDPDPAAVPLYDPLANGQADAGPRVVRLAVQPLKDAEDALGVPRLDGRRVVRIDEKPAKPQSEYAVIGIYMYDAEVYEIIRSLEPSARGELEITDVNNAYIARDAMTWEEIEGWWTDAGTFESLLRASNLVAETGANKMYFEAQR